jgi:outer membrane cobalamin receptor
LTVSPDRHQLSAAARGYAPLAVAVDANRDVRVEVALESLDSPKLRQIGEVTVSGRLAPIVGTIPSLAITRSDFDRLGEDRIIDGLQTLPGAAFARPDGGAFSAVSVVALREPDPSESLIALDGQLLNDGNTGDRDLARFPVSDLSAVDITEELGPEDSNGSNTFGGAIALVSLSPTKVPICNFAFGRFIRSKRNLV